MIRTLIWRKYHVKLSLASVGRLLAQLGLSCQRPLAKAFEQNPSLVEQWVKTEYPKIRAQAKREGAEIFLPTSLGFVRISMRRRLGHPSSRLLWSNRPARDFLST